MSGRRQQARKTGARAGGGARPATRVRLDRAAFERWLASPEGQACSRRRGRPGGDERPLITEAARRFGVGRRSIERALARIARRQRLLAEHQPVDAATAGLLLDAAKSFVVGINTSSHMPQMRHGPEQRSLSTSGQRLASPHPPAPPSRRQLLEALAVLVREHIIETTDLEEVMAHSPASASAAVSSQLAAVGLRSAAPPATLRPGTASDPRQLCLDALLDALDAFAVQSTPLPAAVQTHLDGLRQALQRPAGA